MSKDTYYPQAYQCDSCHKISKHYVWASEAEEARVECKCGNLLTYQHMYDDEPIQSFNIGTKMSKQQIKTDRKKRSTDHFKKEILPTLSKRDRSHFDRKFKK